MYEDHAFRLVLAHLLRGLLTGLMADQRDNCLYVPQLISHVWLGALYVPVLVQGSDPCADLVCDRSKQKEGILLLFQPGIIKIPALVGYFIS